MLLCLPDLGHKCVHSEQIMSRWAAHLVAAVLRDDGRKFAAADGRTLEDVALEHGARIQYARRRVTDGLIHMDPFDTHSITIVRYLFPDGSVIVVAGDAWSIEGTRSKVL